MVLDMGKLAFLAALLAAQAFASDETAIENTFVKPWVAAIRSGDKTRIERFFHPATRACINSSTQLFFDTMVERETTPGTGNAGFRITLLKPMGPQDPLPGLDGFTYPVRPTREVDIQFDNTDLIVIRFLAQENGSWYEVYPCPDATGMAKFRQELVEVAETKQKISQLVAQLKDPLLSELKELLRQDKTIDAIHRYQAAEHVDVGTAMRVINALKQSKP
jgi:hypothetical protein